MAVLCGCSFALTTERIRYRSRPSVVWAGDSLMTYGLRTWECWWVDVWHMGYIKWFDIWLKFILILKSISNMFFWSHVDRRQKMPRIRRQIILDENIKHSSLCELFIEMPNETGCDLQPPRSLKTVCPQYFDKLSAAYQRLIAYTRRFVRAYFYTLKHDHTQRFQ